MAESVPALLRAHGLRPKKGLGQNFLLDETALAKIVEAADLAPEDVVVEVGAGVGNLTRRLAKQAGHVLAVELDNELVGILQEEFAQIPNVNVIHGDILQLAKYPIPQSLIPNLGYKVVGNLPYYITSAVLRHFLEDPPRPQLMVVTVQREVAERIVAEPGDMSVLAVSVQFYGRPQIVARIPAGAFYPPPQVDSAVLRIDVSQQPLARLPDGVSEQDYFRVVKAGFSQRRKTLRNSLSGGLALPPKHVQKALQEAGTDPRRRAQTLSLAEWAAVAEKLG